MRINEKELILPALYVIKQYGSATTSDLIKNLSLFFNPTGEDAEILAGRNDTKFSQKVRNLVSHRETNGMNKYTEFISSKYTISEAGIDYLNDNLDAIKYMVDNNFEFEDIQSFTSAIAKTSHKAKKVIVYSEGDMINEGKTWKTNSVTKKRSMKLREAAIAKYTTDSGHICCSVCGFDFEETYGELGKGFIEMHHEKPIYQYPSEGFDAYISEAVKSIKPLCANCHRMIHRNKTMTMSITELKSHIK